MSLCGCTTVWYFLIEEPPLLVLSPTSIYTETILNIELVSFYCWAQDQQRNLSTKVPLSAALLQNCRTPVIVHYSEIQNNDFDTIARVVLLTNKQQLVFFIVDYPSNCSNRKYDFILSINLHKKKGNISPFFTLIKTKLTLLVNFTHF